MTHLERGIELFNQGSYFESHEALEEQWVLAERRERYFLQGVIHMAVAWHHAEARNFEGAVRQVGKGLRKLAGYLPRYQGVETGALCADAMRWRETWTAGRAVEGPAMIVFRKP
jgi:predicted metal-dependent hydrolase